MREENFAKRVKTFNLSDDSLGDDEKNKEPKIIASFTTSSTIDLRIHAIVKIAQDYLLVFVKLVGKNRSKREIQSIIYDRHEIAMKHTYMVANAIYCRMENCYMNLGRLGNGFILVEKRRQKRFPPARNWKQVLRQIFH